MRTRESTPDNQAAGRVPTVDDARRAARALVESEGVNEVWLYGSVAWGTRTESSDIDLVAVFDDIDYRGRAERSWELGLTASRAAGFRCDVLVTDHPEWRVRTQQVTCSFEAELRRAGAMLLASVPHASEPHWDKEISLPRTNRDDVWGNVEYARRSLTSMLDHLRPATLEQQYIAEGDLAAAETQREQRADKICDAASRSVENVVKALRKLAKDVKSYKPSHEMDRLLNDVDAEDRATTLALFERHGIRLSSVRLTRQTASFFDAVLPPSDNRWYEPEFVVTQADPFARLACDMMERGNRRTARLLSRDKQRWGAHVAECDRAIAYVRHHVALYPFAQGSYHRLPPTPDNNAQRQFDDERADDEQARRQPPDVGR